MSSDYNIACACEYLHSSPTPKQPINSAGKQHRPMNASSGGRREMAAFVLVALILLFARSSLGQMDSCNICVCSPTTRRVDCTPNPQFSGIDFQFTFIPQDLPVDTISLWVCCSLFLLLLLLLFCCVVFGGDASLYCGNFWMQGHVW